MNGDPEILSEGEFIDSDRNMTDRAEDNGIDLNAGNNDMGFEEDNFNDEAPADNDLVGEFGEDFGDMAMDSNRSGMNDFMEEVDFDGDSTPRTDLMDEGHAQTE